MATRTMVKVRADWAKMAATMSKEEMPKFNKLKARVDANLVKMASLPESLPKIDWAHYKAHASDPKIVEEIEKRYNSLQVSFPSAPQSRLDELKKARDQDLSRYQKFVEFAKSYIDSANVVQKKFEDMIPVPDMNMEDYTRTFPLWSFNKDNPSLGFDFGRTAGLSREEQIAFEQPDPVPFATPTAWKDWEIRKKKFYSD